MYRTYAEVQIQSRESLMVRLEHLEVRSLKLVIVSRMIPPILR